MERDRTVQKMQSLCKGHIDPEMVPQSRYNQGRGGQVWKLVGWKWCKTTMVMFKMFIWLQFRKGKKWRMIWLAVVTGILSWATGNIFLHRDQMIRMLLFSWNEISWCTTKILARFHTFLLPCVTKIRSTTTKSKGKIHISKLRNNYTYWMRLKVHVTQYSLFKVS